MEASATERLIELERERGELRQQLDTLRQQIAESPSKSGAIKQPSPGDLLNRLKSQRKRSKADLADVEALLEMLPTLPAS